MSVTFTAAMRPASRFAASCGCERASMLAARHGTYEEALTEVLSASPDRDALPGCEMPDICPEYPLRVHGVDPDGDVPEVNVSEHNAVRLSDLLGFAAVEPSGSGPALRAAGREGYAGPGTDPDSAVLPCATDAGQIPARDFLGRVLIALALTPEDAGVDGYWSGRTHMGGRPAGYLQRRLVELHDLAQWCAGHGRDVVWG